MHEQTEDGPDRYPDNAEIGTADQHRQRQQDEVRISPGGNETKPAIEWPPDMHLDFEAADKNSFFDPLQDVAADNGAEDKIGGGKIEARMRQSHNPRPPPERRMHEIDAVIENIADGARGQRDAGKLAVDRVEERHRISGYKSRSEERRVGKECVSTCRSGGGP